MNHVDCLKLQNVSVERKRVIFHAVVKGKHVEAFVELLLSAANTLVREDVMRDNAHHVQRIPQE